MSPAAQPVATYLPLEHESDPGASLLSTHGILWVGGAAGFIGRQKRTSPSTGLLVYGPAAACGRLRPALWYGMLRIFASIR